MQNGYQPAAGVTPLTQWPMSGGRGRGFAPGRGRGAWSASSSDQDTRPGPVTRDKHVAGHVSDKNCFRFGGEGHQSHRASSQGNSSDHSSGVIHGHKWGDVSMMTYGFSQHRHRHHGSSKRCLDTELTRSEYNISSLCNPGD